MLCKKVVPLLSEYFDNVLDAVTTVQVSQHLGQCLQCRKELKSLSALHGKLRSLNGVQAPEYLDRLVQRRLNSMHQNSWRNRLRNELERRWSRIRTTEGMWYVTRALGTVMTSVFFFLIARTISPLYIDVNAPVEERKVLLSAYGQQVGKHFLANFGMLPPQRTYSYKSVPAINHQYLKSFGESISQDGDDYDFSLLTYVDRSGQAVAQSVVEHPNAESFLNDFNKVISSGRFAPAKKDGEAVPSYMILMFSKISVYTSD